MLLLYVKLGSRKLLIVEWIWKIYCLLQVWHVDECALKRTYPFTCGWGFFKILLLKKNKKDAKWCTWPELKQFWLVKVWKAVIFQT